MQWREHVHLEHEPRPLLGELVERAQERDGRVVHEDVGRADLLDHLGHHAFALLAARQVGLDRDGVPAGGADLVDGLAQ